MTFAPVKTSKWRKDEPFHKRPKWAWPESVWTALSKAAGIIGRSGDWVEASEWHVHNGPQLSPEELSIIRKANAVYVAQSRCTTAPPRLS